jgi:integrase
MTHLTITLGTWNRKRRNAAGKLVRQKRHTINYRCPETGGRVRRSFATRAAAEAAAEAVRAQYAGGKYFNPVGNPTVSDAVEHWMSIKVGQVKLQTMRCYTTLVRNITGPLLQGTPKERIHYAQTGEKPHRDAKLLKMLGDYKVSELSTAQLRQWHNLVRDEVGAYTANEVMGMFKSILALAEEDFGVPVCKMPTNLARRKHKPTKAILKPKEVAKLIACAQADKDRGIFYAFPFLTGMRASEQLGLLWDDIDFARNTLTVRRVQERDGSTTDQTKTEAGQREIPISPTLRRMLLECRLICPRLDGRLYRVFAGPGREQPWPLPRKGAGGPILYSNFLHRYWQPAFKRVGVRYVTHHSARHSFVSTLQAQGVEVGLVAKLAGHANPSVTLGHYTQAVRGGAEALAALDAIYTGTAL